MSLQRCNLYKASGVGPRARAMELDGDKHGGSSFVWKLHYELLMLAPALICFKVACCMLLWTGGMLLL